MVPRGLLCKRIIVNMRHWESIMAINGLGSFDMMSNYNRINLNDTAAKTVSPVVQDVKEQADVTKEAKEAAKPELKVNLNLDGMRRRSPLNLEDISRDFTKREPFVMSGLDDQTMKRDMMKAVSDMEKDSSIQQYNYFVGNNVVLDNEDGTVIMK